MHDAWTLHTDIQQISHAYIKCRTKMEITNLQVKCNWDKEEAKSHSRGGYLCQMVADFKFCLLSVFLPVNVHKQTLNKERTQTHYEKKPAPSFVHQPSSDPSGNDLHIWQALMN